MDGAEYDPDKFFSAERYPLPITCGECGHTMRPVHKHCTPDMPRTYFCTFCGAGFYEDNPCVRFNKRQTNADRIRAYTDLELAMFMTAIAQKSAEKLCESLKTVDVDLSNCDFDILAKAHLDWLQQEAEE